VNYQIDATPKPLSWWAEQWGVHPRTVENWIRKGECPCLSIGGRKMISVVQLLQCEADFTEGVKSSTEGVTETKSSLNDGVPEGGWGPSCRDASKKKNNRGGRRKVPYESLVKESTLSFEDYQKRGRL
jgi:hypothetical protein